MRGGALFYRSLLIALTFAMGNTLSSRAQDVLKSLSFDEATNKDLSTWRDLLRQGKFDELEKIGDDLRAKNSKYRNGRGRLWRYTWTALSDDQDKMTEEDYQRSFGWLEAWLKAHPKSINARLSMANVWEKYAFFARGGRVAPQTPEGQLQMFTERSAKAAKYLDEIAEITDQVDNVYRRLRIELSKGSGEKPDVNLVYDGLKDDPKNLELVHGMAICLLPRWFGEPGELEKFADEVVRRTKKTCGQMQYVTAAVAVKEFLKSYLLDTHDFDYTRLKQGFRDLERLYPESREHLDDEVHFAFMADDLETVYASMAKLGDHPHPDSWRYTEIDLGGFRKRITPEMLAGDQKRLLMGHPRPILALSAVADGKIAVSVNWSFGARLYEIETGKRRGWFLLEEFEGESASIHPTTGLIAGGFRDQPGLMLFSLANGQSGTLAPSKEKIVRTAFSAKGDQVAVADAKGLIVVYDLTTGKLSHDYPAKTPRDITGVAFNSDATKLAASSGSGDLWVFELGADKQADPHKISSQRLRSLARSDKHIAVGTSGGEVHVLDGETLNEVAAWKSEHDMDVSALAFSPDGGKLAIGQRSGNWDTLINTPLFVWAFEKEKSPTALKGHKFGVNCVRFTNASTLISGSNDWTIRVWDVP